MKVFKPLGTSNTYKKMRMIFDVEKNLRLIPDYVVLYWNNRMKEEEQ
jgi:hypothetical protein